MFLRHHVAVESVIVLIESLAFIRPSESHQEPQPHTRSQNLRYPAFQFAARVPGSGTETRRGRCNLSENRRPVLERFRHKDRNAANGDTGGSWALPQGQISDLWGSESRGSDMRR